MEHGRGRAPQAPAEEKETTKTEEKEEAEEEPEEEEEEEEELEDPKEKFEEECRNSKQCAPAKHHFDECVERVTNASDDSGEQEDCVEEFRSTVELIRFVSRSLPPRSLRHPMCRA
ncbi:hypothetical protein CIB48_g9626 [Xylaria polymorpha]|nr:hypothetical protein CIB48_g9626 [Xylaria polymorpha]